MKTCPPTLAVLACDVLREEIEMMRAFMPHIARVDYLPMGLHDRPEVLNAELRERLACMEDDPAIEAVVIVYGLCGTGTAGLGPRRVPCVIARAHDCVTLYLGSKERYADYQRKHPDAYFFTPGWMRGGRTPGPERLRALREEYSKRFDEDSIDFLLETEQDLWLRHSTAAYIDFGATEDHPKESAARADAEWLGWEFHRLEGNDRLLRSLLLGQWDAEDFLVVRPGEHITISPDSRIMSACHCASACRRR